MSAHKQEQHRDVQDTLDELDRCIGMLTWTRQHIITLHSVAYESDKGGTDKVHTTKLAHYGDETGKYDAKVEWGRLRAWLGLANAPRVHNALHALTAICTGLDRILTCDRKGKLSTVDAQVRATPISKDEFEEAQRMQRKRGGLAPLVKQPKHTGRR